LNPSAIASTRVDLPEPVIAHEERYRVRELQAVLDQLSDARNGVRPDLVGATL